MIKVLLSSSVLVLTMIGNAGAEIYTGPNPGGWGDGANWDTGFVPTLQSGGEAVIKSGATVDYDAGALGDLKIDGGGSLTISNGSSWSQSTTTHWTQINDGKLI